MSSKTFSIPPKRGFTAATGVLFLVSSFYAVLGASPQAAATSTSGFNAGNIMSDAVMSNKSTMTQSQIQSFMLSKNSCNKSVSSAGGSVIDDSTTQAHWVGSKTTYQIRGGKKGTANGTFNCLARSSFSGQSASQIIYQASQDYNINPQVLIVLLEKEQGLITDLWPNSTQLASATGYNCPDDDAGCRGSDAAFKKQVRGAGNMFHSILTKKYGWTNFYPVGTNYIQYNPSTSCGGSNVKIQNLATSALYNYTPYQPNAATLKAGWPSPGAPCGAYGNLNFYMYFTTWFGTTKYTISGSILKYYEANDGSTVLGAAADQMKSDGNGFYWQKFEKGYIAGQASTGYYAIKGSIGKYYDVHNGPALLNKPLAPEQKDAKTGIWSQPFAKGHIMGTGSKGYFSIRGSLDTAYQKYGGISRYGQPSAEQTNLGPNAHSQQFQNGYYIVGSGASRYYESTGATRAYWQAHDANKGVLGFPVSNPTTVTGGTYQLYQGGVVIGRSNTTYYAVKGSIGKTYVNNLSKQLDSLGFPVAEEVNLGGAYEQKFQNGYITGGNGHYYQTSNAIHDYWKTIGAQSSRLGLPKKAVSTLGNNELQVYTGGVIIGSSTTGYHDIKGSIGKTYLSDIPKYYKDLGAPVAEESRSSGIWQQHFEKGYLTAGEDAYYESYGSIRNYWLSIGGWSGEMGLITGPVATGSRNMVYQHYETGVLLINPNSGKVWESKGSIRKVWASYDYQSGKLGFPTGPEVLSPEGIWSQKYEHGTIETKNGKKYRVTFDS